ncbi:hypothetical protein [Homoserinibacter sp. YIM 151385]|uniref:hypothetical protein n=1 Tax=Homoserinibacter sp. YIM 151385 TaxID=2985506 RepID=UPI0022F09AC2|nr:hypothetical protein [Homoserinibacter sp. YIM 151385]WBU39243.1 hypothetical protein OF852_06610 [Homoserinibacter sp. YIM 151385]
MSRLRFLAPLVAHRTRRPAIALFLVTTLGVGSAPIAASAEPAGSASVLGPSVARAGTTLVESTEIPGCADQVIEADGSAAEARELCSATLVTSQGPVETASAIEIRDEAASLGWSVAETERAAAAAASGAIRSRTWVQTYWGASNWERHEGRTYWDGSRAWVASYRGKTGRHVCHTEGSWAIGWVITPVRCTKPKAAAAADAYYRFDAQILFKGSPITLGVAMHYQMSRTGAVKQWKIGG